MGVNVQGKSVRLHTMVLILFKKRVKKEGQWHQLPGLFFV